MLITIYNLMLMIYLSLKNLIYLDLFKGAAFGIVTSNNRYV